MFSHVMVGVKDLEASKKFYDAVLSTVGIAPGMANNKRYFYRSPTGTFGITTPINGEAASVGNGSTYGFKATSAEQAEAFHSAGIANGGVTCVFMKARQPDKPAPAASAPASAQQKSQ